MPEVLRQHGDAHLAGFLDHACERDLAVVFRVDVGLAPDTDAAGGRVQFGQRGIPPALQRRDQGQRFHRRARLVHIGHGAVAHVCRVHAGAVIGVVNGVVDHRQHLAGVGVEGDHRTGGGAQRGDGILQFAMLQVLQAQVDTQAQVAPGLRRLEHAEVTHHLAVQVLDVFLLAGNAPEPVVVGQLQARDTLAVEVGEAHQLRGDLAGGVEPAIFALAVNALDIQVEYASRILGHAMALQVHEALAVVARQLVAQGRALHIQRPRQFVQAIGVFQLLRVRPDRHHRRAHRQGLAPAIGDNAAIRGNFRGAHKAHRALLFQEVAAVLGVQHLQHQHATDQQGHQARQPEQHQVETPGRL